MNREAVIQAMADFDRNGLPTGFGPSVYYDLVHPTTGNIYPPKAIWGMAAGLTAYDFNAVSAKRYLEKLGFKILERRTEEPIINSFDETARASGADGAVR